MDTRNIYVFVTSNDNAGIYKSLDFVDDISDGRSPDGTVSQYIILEFTDCWKHDGDCIDVYKCKSLNGKIINSSLPMISIDGKDIDDIYVVVDSISDGRSLKMELFTDTRISTYVGSGQKSDAFNVIELDKPDIYCVVVDGDVIVQ